MYKISRHYTDEALLNATIETRIAIYEDRVRGWFLDQARILEKASDHGAYVILMVAIGYMEGHAIFLRGESSDHRSLEFFACGFREVFRSFAELPSKITEEIIIKEIFHQVRCGLFHQGATRGKVVLSRSHPDPLVVEGRAGVEGIAAIHVNPHALLDIIEAHLSSYLCRLRNPAEKNLRENFDKAWNLIG